MKRPNPTQGEAEGKKIHLESEQTNEEEEYSSDGSEAMLEDVDETVLIFKIGICWVRFHSKHRNGKFYVSLLPQSGSRPKYQFHHRSQWQWEISHFDSINSGSRWESFVYKPRF